MAGKASLFSLFPKVAHVITAPAAAPAAPAKDAPPVTTAAAPPAGSQEPPPTSVTPEPESAPAATTLADLEHRKKALDATITRLRRSSSPSGDVDYMAQAMTTPNQKALAEAEAEAEADRSDNRNSADLAQALEDRVDVLKEIAALSVESPVVVEASADSGSDPMFRERGRKEVWRRLREMETGQRELPQIPTLLGRVFDRTSPFPSRSTYTEPSTGERFAAPKPLSTALDFNRTVGDFAELPVRAVTYPLRAILPDADPTQTNQNHIGGTLGGARKLRTDSLTELELARVATGGRRTTATGKLPKVQPRGENRSVFHGLPIGERVQLAGDLRDGAAQTLNDIDAEIQQMERAGKTNRRGDWRYRKLSSQRVLIQEQMDLMVAVTAQLRRVQIAEANKQKAPLAGDIDGQF